MNTCFLVSVTVPNDSMPVSLIARSTVCALCNYCISVVDYYVLDCKSRWLKHICQMPCKVMQCNAPMTACVWCYQMIICLINDDYRRKLWVPQKEKAGVRGHVLVRGEAQANVIC